MALTDSKVRGLYSRAQKGEAVGKISDGGGLNFQDGKYWRLSYRFAGKQQTLALGVYPDVSLKMARMARDRARELLAQGINPCEQKKQDKAKARRLEQESRLTFEIVAREWFEKKTRNLTLTYRKQKRQRLEKYLFPTVGNIPMAELDLPDLAAALKPLHGKADMSKRVAVTQKATKKS